ncbi:MAG: Fe-S oxidoreductase [Candidatus Ozemobacter sibiricus]|uniref:Fe-S oxidoreductase n=1 Tax=Candidatus Ozemobacter sibiricus TaxID=2268124 RepID=A0A367ZIB8_9BACT|nr:MAG: Fe-S oxidoreductase [Candidatus Ozemobacter sibiricus]
MPGRPPLTRLDLDMNRGFDALAQELILLRPTVAAFASYIWSQPLAVALAGALKAAFPEVCIIFGGPEASFGAPDLLQNHPWIDLVIKGEGEVTFEEVLLRVLAREDCAGIPGVVRRLGPPSAPPPPSGSRSPSSTEQGAPTWVMEPDRPPIQTLDSIPSPFQSGLYGKGHGFTYYESTRGCPYRCAYCLSSVLGPLRSFSLDRVKADLDWFFASDFTQVRFADRTFNQDPARAAAIIEHILRGNTRQIGFHFELKADTLDERLIDLLGEAPPDLFHLEIGVQSTHHPTLAAVDRRSDLSRLRENVIRLRERTRCHVHLDLLAGLPQEDLPAFRRTLDDAFRMRPSTIQVGLVKVLKGTALATAARRGDLAHAPQPPYAVVRTRWLDPAEVVRIQDIGKLVEGIHNPGRFSASLAFLIREAYNNSPSSFYEALADFWRKSGRPFYQFGPEAVAEGLRTFVAAQPEVTDQHRRAFEALLAHEARLAQKVPSGPPGPRPAFPAPTRSPTWRLAPGLRIFWYPTDPLALLATSTAQVPPQERPRSWAASCHPAPVVYQYETDLSRPPRTIALDLPLRERLVLAFIDLDLAPESFSAAAQLVGQGETPPQEWTQALDVVKEKGFVWNVQRLPKSSRSAGG